MKKIAAAASLMLAALMVGCSNGKINVNIGKNYSESAETDKSFLFETADSISALDIDIEVGNIKVEYSDSGKTELILGCKAFAKSDSVCQEVLSHISAKSEAKDDTLFISLIDESTGKDINDWLDKNIPDCRIELDAYITVPTYMESFSTSADIGNISLLGLKGSFEASADVGNITCSGLELTGSSEISCDVGNITMNDVIYKADTKLDTDTGNISFDMPGSGSGGADIAVHCDIGDINLNSAGCYTIKDEKKEIVSHRMTIVSENCNIDLSVDTGDISTKKEKR